MAYVYIYEVPELDAVKIGKTRYSARDRMWDYADSHGFRPNATSLKIMHVGEESYHDIEDILHRKIGLRRLRWGSATELFGKGGKSYGVICEDMESVIDKSMKNGKVRAVSRVDWGKVAISGLGALLSGRRKSGFVNTIMKEVFGFKRGIF